MKKAFKLSALVAMFAMALLLVGCVPASVKSAKSKMEKAGYTLLAEVKGGEDSDVEANLTWTKHEGAVIGGSTYTVNATYYKTAKAAKEAYNDLKENSKDGNTSAKLSGKVIYWGDAQGMKDFN